MNSSATYSRQAEFALAAYSNLTPGMARAAYEAALRDDGRGMSPAQASRFASQWRVVDQYSHSEQIPTYDDAGNLTGYLTSSNGLSVTLFEENTSNGVAGRKVVAIRGTDDGTDFVTNIISIGLIGSTAFQSQYRSLREKVLEWRSNGSLSDSFTVTGHSLGGFLATGLAQEFAAHVEHAYLYNSPGIDGAAATGPVASLLKALGIDNRVVNPSRFSNIRAAVGISPIAGTGLPVSPVIPIQIEDQFLSDVADPPGSRNHSQQVLTDALAVYALYSELAPALSVGAIGTLLRSASDTNSRTLENALDALRTTLGFFGETPREERNALYQNLYEVRDSSAYAALKGVGVRVLAYEAAGSVADKAKSDFGYFLAVEKLLPFAVEGAPGALQQAHAGLYALWEADGQKRGSGAALEYSDEYLADRAAMLAWKVKLGNEDFATIHLVPYPFGVASDFEDRVNGERIYLGQVSQTADRRHFVFGSDAAEADLAGGNRDDRMYGGGGGDTLTGGSGNDLLDGGRGADTLRGGRESDTLIGGADDDVLEGGTGYDRYVIGRGNDRILDEDGQGYLTDERGRLLAGAWEKRPDGKYYWLADTKVAATFNSPFTIDLGQGASVVIEDFSDGDLGITLAQPPETPASEALGDEDPDYLNVGDHLIVGPPALVSDSFHFLAGVGPDFVLAPYNGEDLVEGGTEADILVAGNGDDQVFGDAKADLGAFIEQSRTAGGTGARGDWAGGGLGEDILVGSHADDVLMGGGGRDVLVGGAGDDIIDGDDSLFPTEQEMADLPTAGSEFAEVNYRHPKFDWTVNRDEPFQALFDDTVAYHYAREVGAADVIYAGAGNDIAYGLMGDDVLYGEAGDDVLRGDDGNDILLGGPGNDRLAGEARGLLGGDDLPVQFPGDDYLDGEEGNDELVGEDGADTLLGGTGDDELFGDADYLGASSHGDDFLDGEAGDDFLRGYGGNDTLLGGEGNDRLFGEDGDDTLDGDAGNDELLAGAGDDALTGSAGDDLLSGEAGADRLSGGEGADQLLGGGGNDVLDGGEGADLLAGGPGDDLYLADADDTIQDGEGEDRIEFSSDVTAENVTAAQAMGADGERYLVISDGAGPGLAIRDGFLGRFRDYTLADGTLLSHDALMTGAVLGPLVIQGKETADYIVGAGAGDELYGNGGADTVKGGEGNDQLSGGEGDDSIEGQAGDDTLYADAGADALSGGEGADGLFGGDGTDRLEGGAGDDVLAGGAGADRYVLNPGEGRDVIEDDSLANVIEFGPGIAAADLSASAFTGEDGGRYLEVRFGGGSVAIQDGELGRVREYHFADGTVVTHGAIMEAEPALVTQGSRFADEIAGSSLADALAGGEGDDLISAAGGDDVLDGGPGADRLQGGAGNDDLSGGAGNDLLIGGEGTDRYLMAYGMGLDTVEESGAGPDTIRLMPGLAIADLGAARDGDHLRVFLRLTGEGLVLRDYGLQPRPWRIEASDGVSMALEDFVAQAAGGQAADSPEAARQEYRARLQATFQATLASHGYRMLPDGSFEQSSGYSDPTLTLNRHTVASLHLVARADDGAEIFTGTAFDEQLVNFSEALVPGQNQFTSRGLPLGAGSGAEGSVFYPAGINYSVPPGGKVVHVYVPAGASEAGSRTPDGSTHYVLKGTRVFPPASAGGGGLGGATLVLQQSYDFRQTVTVEELEAGPGASAIRVSGNGVVDAGAGDDWIDASGTNPSPYPLEIGIGRGATPGAFLYGNQGNDSIVGSDADDVIAGGEGDDALDGAAGADSYLSFAGEGGQDELFDRSGLTQDQYADGFYESLGIPDWRLRTSHGGQWVVDWGNEGFFAWNTLQEVPAEYRSQVKFVEPLHMFPPSAVANDYTSLRSLYTAGWIDQDVFLLPQGVAPGDLQLCWGEVYASPEVGGANQAYRTLDLSWGTGAGVRVVVPHGDDLLGAGIERVRFADGSELGMAELFALAPPAPTLDPENLDNTIAGSDADDSFAGRAGDDVLTGLAGSDGLSGDEGCDILRGGEGDDVLGDWLDASLLEGGAGDDTLAAERGLAAGGTGNDALHPGAGGVVLAFNAGDGQDTVSLWSRGSEPFAISLGGGLSVLNLSLAREGYDLVLDFGAGDAVRLSGYWERTGTPILLQEFGATVRTYDLSAALAPLTGLDAEEPWNTYWQRTVDLSGHLLSESADAALGGALAHAYATAGSTDALPLATIRAALAGPDFGLAPQPIAADEPAVISGTSGTDILAGTTRADTFAGGAGNDTLAGGAGSDTYVFNLGDGVDSIVDAAGAAEPNAVTFGAGITPEMISLGVGSLLLRVGNGGDAIHLDPFDPADPFGAHAVEEFRFADGTVLSYGQLLARGFDLVGSEAADLLSGTALDDRIQGLGGDDALDSGAGDDVLDGGPGNDLLLGGAGSDTYFLASGSGRDEIEDVDAGSLDSDRLLVDAVPSAVEVTRSESHLTVALKAGGSAVAIRWGSGFGIEAAEFADGTVWDAATLEDRVNDAPVLSGPLPDATASEDVPFEYAIPGGTFADADAWDTLTLDARLDDGSPLPGWLDFDPATGTLSGTPGNDDVGTLSITVSATDSGGLSASSTFLLTAANVNDAPVLLQPLADQAAPQDAAWSWQVPAGAFGDVDRGDALSFSASLADPSTGSGQAPLPGWLRFDAASRTFSGVPDDPLRSYALRVSATDREGAGASGLFNLAVTPAPVAEIAGGWWHDTLHGGEGRDHLSGRGGHDRLQGGGGHDLLEGGGQGDFLDGGAGRDLLDGGEGADYLAGGSGNDLLLGGAGADTLRGGEGADFLAGGGGDDALWAGARDVIAFRAGDGRDTLRFEGDGPATLSLSGVAPGALSLRRHGSDLELSLVRPRERGWRNPFFAFRRPRVAPEDKLVLKDWYAAGEAPVSRLQLVGETVETYDFAGMVAGHDAARRGPLDEWSLSQALLDAHLDSSSDEALGGELAGRYGLTGSLAGVTVNAAQAALADPRFGAQPQALRPPAGLHDGLLRLS